MKPGILSAAAVLSALLLFFSLAGCRQETQSNGSDDRPMADTVPDTDSTVLTLDGEPVSREEFLHVMEGETGAVFAYFSRKYGVQGGKAFWNSRFEAGMPIEILKQITLEKIKRIKIEQILMQQHGIVADISYRGFLADLQNENARRKISLEKKMPVYGPTQFDRRTYYDVLHGNRLERLRNTLTSGEQRPSAKVDTLVARSLKSARVAVNSKIFAGIHVE